MQYPARSLFGFTCRAILCVSFCASFLIQGQEVRQAIRPEFGDVPDLASNRRPHVRRVHAISVDLGLFDRSAASRFQRGDRVAFPLFPDVNVSVELQTVEVAPEDDRVTWIGHVEGTRFGELVLVKTGDMLSANISTDSGPVYQIRGSEHGWVAKEIDPSRVPAGAPPRTPPRSEVKNSSAAIERQVAADDGSTIDVMVVYTPAVRAAEGGTAAIQNEVDLAIATANQVYVNSGIIQRVRLVYKGETNYTESGSFDTDLTRLQNPSDGYLDDVQQLRNQYGADLVSLWIDHGDAGVGGLGFIMLDTSGFDAYADSVVLRDAVDSVYAFVHEMGHNMGAAHDRAHADSQGLYSYSYGYEQMVQSPKFRTIMAYPCATVNCPVIGYFSNPNVQYSGVPTGVPAGSSGESDNRLTLNNSRVVVANFRQSVQTGGSPPLSISLNPPSISVSSSGGSGTVTVTANGNWSVTGLPSWISVTGSASGSGSGTISYTVAPNTATSSRSISVTVGTTTFTVSQAGSSVLSISLNPPGATVPFTGGSGSANITASGSWTVTSVPSWISVTSTSGSGNAILSYTVSANSSAATRVGSISVGNSAFTVTQAGAPAVTPAVLLSPVPGSVLSGDTVTVSWSAGSSASDYWLDVGNSLGHGDIYASAQGASTLSRTVAGIPTDGRTIYVRLWTQVGGVWQFNTDYTFTAANQARANLLSPAPGDTFGSGTVNFVWSTVPTATNYWLDVGSTPGHGDLYASAQVTLNSRTVSNLPIDGRTIYVRLWTYIGSWQTPIDYTLTACWSNCNDQALLLTPASGSAITSSTPIFTWTPVSGASNYWLDVGDHVGVGDFYAGAQGSGTTQRAVAGLPTDGRVIYARLWTQVAGTWINHTDYAFTACSGACAGDVRAGLLSPLPGSILPSTATFSWSPGTGATKYWLDVGTSQGQGNLYAGDQGPATQHTVSGIPAATVIWVRLWTYYNGAWLTPIDYNFAPR